MAFDIANFTRVTTSGNAEGQSRYSYTSSDAMATVIASNYFNGVKNTLRQNDLIDVELSDCRGTLRVTSTDLSGTPTVVGEGVFNSSVTVSSAELLALRAAPKTIVPAPGAGFLLRFVSGSAFLDHGGTDYVEQNAGDDLSIRYTGAAGTKVSRDIDATNFIAVSVDTWANIESLSNIIAAATASENQPLVAHNEGAAEWTTGDGVLRLTVNYTVDATGF